MSDGQLVDMHWDDQELAAWPNTLRHGVSIGVASDAHDRAMVHLGRQQVESLRDALTKWLSENPLREEST